MDWIISNRRFNTRTLKEVDGCNKGVRISYRVSRSWTWRLGKRERQKQRRILLRRLQQGMSKSKSKSKSKQYHLKRGKTSSSMCSAGGSSRLSASTDHQQHIDSHEDLFIKRDHQQRVIPWWDLFIKWARLPPPSSRPSASTDHHQQHMASQVIPWRDLPTHFAGLLLERLPLCDYVNFGAVCNTWRSLRRRTPHRCSLLSLPPPCYIPMNAGARQGHETVPCFSPFDQRHDTLVGHKEIPWGQRIIINPSGTCHPYIIALRRRCDLLTVSLLNPISGHEITLPGNPMSWSDFEQAPCYHLSLSHSSPPRYTVFITFVHALLFHREGDRDWTLLNLPWFVCNFNTLRGDLYALRASEGARYLLAVSSTHPAPSVHEFAMDTSHLPSPASMVPHFSVPHLVESPNGEELLLVLEIRKLHDCWPLTVGFQVFKADLSRKTWIPKDEALGDRALFIRGQQSLFLSPASVGHGVKGNCIYFSHLCTTGQTPLKMFDMDSKTMSDVSIPFPSKYIPVMFVPSIC